MFDRAGREGQRRYAVRAMAVDPISVLIVSLAYERTGLIVTPDLAFQQYTEVMGSERLTAALLDRLTHHVHILEGNGESCRLRQSRGEVGRATSAGPREESS